MNINFSSRTTSADVQTNIEANIDKRSGVIYGPPTGRKLIVFIDDLNMPKVDTYGTQQPIALLLFLMNKNSLYDRSKDLNLKTIKDLQYVAAMVTCLALLDLLALIIHRSMCCRVRQVEAEILLILDL